MRSLLRLVLYYVLLTVILSVVTSYRESFERVVVQIVLFSVISFTLVVLIRQNRPILRHSWPEILYLLATGTLAIASVLRLAHFH